MEPRNGAWPNEKIPPSDATSQYPLPSGAAAIPTTGWSGADAREPWNGAPPRAKTPPPEDASQYEDPEGPKPKLRPMSAGTACMVANRFPVVVLVLGGLGYHNAPASDPEVTRNDRSTPVGVFARPPNGAPSGDKPIERRAWITSAVESGSLLCWLSAALGS